MEEKKYIEGLLKSIPGMEEFCMYFLKTPLADLPTIYHAVDRIYRDLMMGILLTLWSSNIITKLNKA